MNKKISLLGDLEPNPLPMPDYCRQAFFCLRAPKTLLSGHGKGVIKRLRCKRWNCEGCNPYLKYKYLSIIRYGLQTLPEGWSADTISNDTWTRLGVKFSKAKLAYTTIKYNKTRLVIVNSKNALPDRVTLINDIWNKTVAWFATMTPDIVGLRQCTVNNSKSWPKPDTSYWLKSVKLSVEGIITRHWKTLERRLGDYEVKYDTWREEPPIAERRILLNDEFVRILDFYPDNLSKGELYNLLELEFKLKPTNGKSLSEVVRNLCYKGGTKQ